MLNLSVETPVVVEGNPVFWLRNFLGKVSFFLVVEMVLELSGVCLDLSGNGGDVTVL